jgi:S-layer protein
LNIQDAALKTLTISGNGAVTLTVDTVNVAVTSINGSAMTGKLTAATAVGATAAATITGGSGSDALTANHASDVLLGGTGNDTLTLGNNAGLVTLTGGTGNDTFNVASKTSNSNNYATITDLAAGDIIKFSATAVDFMAAGVTLAGTAVFQDYVNEAVKISDTGDISWFQFGGNTYVVENVSNSTSYVNGTDGIVQITGLINLATSSMSSTAFTALVIA